MNNNKGYTLVKETGSDTERKKIMMTLAQKELSKPENIKRMRVINGNIRDLKRRGKYRNETEYGATVFKTNGRKYYLYPNMLAEFRRGDTTLRIVYLISPNKDTIKLAKEKCKALGLINGVQNIVSVYLNSMNLQGK